MQRIHFVEAVACETVCPPCDDMVHDFLYRQVAHNKDVRTTKENQIIGFEMDGIRFDENVHYPGIKCTIDTLNDESKSKRKNTDRPPYVYTGQNPHGLAYEYYKNNFDKNITMLDPK